MIVKFPNGEGTGTSFKGAFAYYLHDKRSEFLQQEGIAVETSHRVDWVEMRNMPTNDPEKAAGWMAFTAMQSEALKERAGIGKAGRKSPEHVLAYSLSWDESEIVSKAEMLRAADETIRVLGAEDRQAVLIAHNDTAHPHVHVIINRVSPEDGRLLGLRQSQNKAQEWALAYEREKGKIFCQAREEKDAGRKEQRAFEQQRQNAPGHAYADPEMKGKFRENGPEMEAAQSSERQKDAMAAKGTADQRRHHSREQDELDDRYRVRKDDLQKARTQALKEHGERQARERKTEATRRRDIRDNPAEILKIVTDEKSVFTREDIAKALHRYIDDAKEYQAALSKVMVLPELVELRAESKDQAARYSTVDMIAVERDMARQAEAMAGRGHHKTDAEHVRVAMRRADEAIFKSGGGTGLSDEQRAAIRHVTGSEGLSCVIGAAGAGKSTLLGVAREAWEASGYRVRGAALAGKAADGLEVSSGIESRTLASMEARWKAGKDVLGSKDILVIDEAAMVGSRQLSRFVAAAEQAGAKLVLVGDHEQLQSINAGAAFRTLAERAGAASLTEVRRQREGWQRSASMDFAEGRTAEALKAYADKGALKFSKEQDQAKASLVVDYLADAHLHPAKSRIGLAHRRVDVREINEMIRAGRQQRGELAGERVYKTREGQRSFAPGDRLVFLANDRDLAVKNGMLGTVEQTLAGQISVKLDGSGRRVDVALADYAALDHGYCTTIHKSQGATVDRAFVLGSRTMDRHLAYVAMTRHREKAALYAGRDQFKDMTALTSRLGRSGLKESTLDYAAEEKITQKSIRSEFSARLAGLRDWFLDARDRLLSRQAKEREQTRSAWRHRNQERRENYRAASTRDRVAGMRRDAERRKSEIKAEKRVETGQQRRQDSAARKSGAHRSDNSAKAQAAQNAAYGAAKGRHDFIGASRAEDGKDAFREAYLQPGANKDKSPAPDRKASFWQQVKAAKDLGDDGHEGPTHEPKRKRSKDRAERKERQRDKDGRERSRTFKPRGPGLG